LCAHFALDTEAFAQFQALLDAPASAAQGFRPLRANPRTLYLPLSEIFFGSERKQTPSI
jgi:hypothetical protein